MSSSANGATNTSYLVSFNAATAGAVQGIAVDFCSNSPIIGDTCTKPSGFDLTASPSVTGVTVTGMSGGTWTASSTNNATGYRTFYLNNTSATGTVSAGGNITFTITTVTNPTNVNTTFYARFFTFAATGQAATWAAASGGNGSSTTNVVDAGGVALSTVQQLAITAKVQETLTFCIYRTGSSCGTPGTTAIALGDTNGVLSSAGPFVDVGTRYDIATNAGGTPNTTIRFTGPLPTSGSNTIASIGSSATSSAAGTSQFGLCTWKSAGTGSLTPSAPYNNASCNTTSQTGGTGSTGGAGSAQFAFDTSAAAGTYGSTLATTTAGASSTGSIAVIGNTSTTQPAGIYQNTLTFIATATY